LPGDETLRFVPHSGRDAVRVRYWWVNQNQTYRHEVDGGYLWSPKRKKNGRNPFYEFMREVSPGDLVFSFCDQRIRAIGLPQSHAYEAPKPPEFGEAGRNWDAIGWRVDVLFQAVSTLVRPADWIDLLRPLLPPRYAPLLPDGRGMQGIYLTELSPQLAIALADLISAEIGALARSEVVAERIVDAPRPEAVLWEEHLRRRIEADPALSSTDREALVLARRGQGLFRQRVQQFESRCRVTSVDRSEHLRASHCKPWRDSSHDERLAGENGLLLTPSIDHLFDRGFISFEAGGRLLISPVAHGQSLKRMGVPVDREVNVGSFSSGQKVFLEYHRDEIFLRAHLRR
jgi:putative restriction endonuclease